MRFRHGTLALLVVAAGCSGHGGNSAAGNGVPVPTGPQSPGGIWVATTPPVSTLTLFVAEDGDMRVSAEGPSFGAGAVMVTNLNQVTGSYHLRALQPSQTNPAASNLTCFVAGTVTTRTTMQLTVDCTDDAGASTERRLSFFYDATYEMGSSLADIAGNYTLEFRPATNTLNINGDGTLFGMLDNGPQCLLNGVVEIIDARFDLYRVTLSYSNCTRLPQYEGVTMTGFARRAYATQAGAFYAFLTGIVDAELSVLSVIYVPS